MKRLLCFPLVAILSMHGYGQSFVNPSLEAWATAGICETNTPPNGWTDYSNIGIGPDEGTLSICPSTIPPNAASGNTYARCLAGNPSTGEGMYQFVSGFMAGSSYLISYQFCGSNLWGGSGDCVWHLFIDDIDVNQSAIFSSGSPAWQTNYYTFTATLATHKIGLRAYTPTFNGGGSAAIDNFMITESKHTGLENNFSAEDISVYPNPFAQEAMIKFRHELHDATFKLYNLYGQLVREKNSVSGKEIILIRENLNSGVYFIEILDKAHKLYSSKIMLY